MELSDGGLLKGPLRLGSWAVTAANTTTGSWEERGFHAPSHCPVGSAPGCQPAFPSCMGTGGATELPETEVEQVLPAVDFQEPWEAGHPSSKWGFLRWACSKERRPEFCLPLSHPSSLLLSVNDFDSERAADPDSLGDSRRSSSFKQLSQKLAQHLCQDFEFASWKNRLTSH